MKDGFIKVAVATPELCVADCGYNAEQIITLMGQAQKQGVKLLVFPELCITGATCGDLFLQDTLLENAKKAMKKIADATEGMDMLVFAGLPIMIKGKLYNVAAAMREGELLGLIPKTNLLSHGEFSEGRYFCMGKESVTEILVDGTPVLFGKNILFTCESADFTVAAEIGSDLWAVIPPSSYHAMAGAEVIVNLSAVNEIAGRREYRKELIKQQSAGTVTAYCYAEAGEGESTTDVVYAGYNMIAENGTLLCETPGFTTGLTITEIDIQKIRNERRRTTGFSVEEKEEYTEVYYSLQTEEDCTEETALTRSFARLPFVPETGKLAGRAEEILQLQAAGLKKRLQHTNCKTAVIGISGGLDSTLALLVACRAFDRLGIPRTGILSVTMPCFGTTDRTYRNALLLAKTLGTTVREVPIAESVRRHFADIGHDESVHDVTFENSQARERTQVLMDIANGCNGMVIGTGDLSELALGWATYNGDHMSMYAVNADVPKTLVRCLVDYEASCTKETELEQVLRDILDTPVSPELLPPKEGEIAQKTEDLVGPYELHDFFLYYALRFGFRPQKILRMACHAFAGEYTEEVIRHWLKTFYRRFFSQQFKRSCLPDGPKVGSVGVSPRGDLHMPSDACAKEWMEL